MGTRCKPIISGAISASGRKIVEFSILVDFAVRLCIIFFNIMEINIFIILFLLLFGSINVSGQAVLLDKTTGQRISYAQILNNKGAVVGT